MSDRIQTEIEDRLCEFSRFLDLRAYFSAAVKYGEVINCARNYLDQNKEYQNRLPTIADSALAPLIFRETADEVKSRINRISRILSVGDEFTYEEIMLIVTLRIEIALALETLDYVRWDISEFRLSDIDQEIDDAMSRDSNKYIFRDSILASVKNWGINLKLKWIEEHT